MTRCFVNGVEVPKEELENYTLHSPTLDRLVAERRQKERKEAKS